MTHPDVEAQVDAYLDGELAASDAAELEAHLAGCASCGRFRDDRLALRAAIAARDAQSSRPRRPCGRGCARRCAKRLHRVAPAALLAPAAWRWAGARRVARRRRGRQLAARGGAHRVGDPDRRGAGEPRALAHARPPQRRGLVRPAHREAVVQRQARLLAAGARFRRARLSAARRPARLSQRAAGGGPGVRPAAARDQRLPVAGGRARGQRAAPLVRQGYHVLHWATPEFAYWVASDLGLSELTDLRGAAPGSGTRPRRRSGEVGSLTERRPSPFAWTRSAWSQLRKAATLWIACTTPSAG